MNPPEPTSLPGIEELESLYDLKLSPRERRRTESYLGLLEKWGRRVNLVGKLSRRQLLQFHFFESFWVAQHLLQEGSAGVDVGSGAGFPGLAARIRRPALDIVLIEPNFKKAAFLREAGRVLGLETEVFEGRAEEFPHWSTRDWALIRALRPGGGLLEVLRRHQVSLILLHGKEVPLPPEENFQTVRRLPIPGSRRRRASVVQLGLRA